jgi:abnormal spindle-like microcephaly-associated protein
MGVRDSPRRRLGDKKLVDSPRKTLGNIKNCDSPVQFAVKAKLAARVTTERAYKPIKKAAPKAQAVSKEAVLTLGQFQEMPWLDFGALVSGETKTMKLQVINPGDKIGHLTVEKIPSKHGFSLDTTELSVNPGDSATIAITWSPVEDGGVRSDIRFKFNKRVPLQVRLLGNSGTTTVKKEEKRVARSTSGRPSLRDRVSDFNTKGQASLKNSAREPAQKTKPATKSAKPAQDKPKSVRPAGSRLKDRVTNSAFKQDTKTQTKSTANLKIRKASALAKIKTLKASGKPSGNLEKSVRATTGGVKKAVKQKLERKIIAFDENWADKQEKGFAHWINYTLYPPEQQLELEEDEQAAMAAKGLESNAGVFQQLVQTRHDAAMRRRAFQLYHNSDMDSLMLKIETEVKSGRLAIRTDRDLHADIGLRESIVQLLLSYHPTWLRCGLEIVFGHVINLNGKALPTADAAPQKRQRAKAGGHSGKAAKKKLTKAQKVLRSFVLEQLLESPDLKQRFAKAGTKVLKHTRHDKQYQQALREHILQKVLMLVHFLDHAKRAELIDGCPCLFTKSAIAKSSCEVLIGFCKNYLSGEGDVLRHLSMLQYEVSYKQSPLDEVNFRVGNLAVDLRDGLRLVRLVETLMHETDENGKALFNLSRKLRMPADSRLQKVHNVKLALNRLSEHDAALTEVQGGLVPRDIVDGHREKTLGLLWKLIFHWKLSLLLNKDQLKEEIGTIEQLHGTQHHKPLVQAQADGKSALSEGKEELTLLLRWCQLICATYGVAVTDFTTSFADGKALCLLVHFYHPQLVTLKQVAKTTADLPCTKSVQAGDKNFNEVLEFSEEVTKADYNSALAGERANFSTANEAARSLGCVPVMMPEFDSAYVPEEKMVITFTTYLCARLLDSSNEIRATLKVQKVWRQHHQRTYVAPRRAAAQQIQRCWLMKNAAKALMMALRREMAKREGVALKLQASCRGRTQRKAYAKVQQSVLLIQTLARGKLLTTSFKTIHDATCCIQHRMKAFVEGLRMKIVHNNAAEAVQAVFRGHVAKQHYQHTQCCVWIIQAFARKASEHSSYCQLKSAATFVQTSWRNKQLERYAAGVTALVSLQSAIRRKQAQSSINAQHQCACTVQACFRSFVQALEYNKFRAAVISLQAMTRSSTQSTRFTCTKMSAVVVQSFARGWAVCKMVAGQHNAAEAVQAVFRGHVAKQHYQHTQRCIVTVQAFGRGAIQQKDFKTHMCAVVTIQSALRCRALSKQFAGQQSAVIAVQAVFRGHVAKQHYQHTQRCIVTVQASIRAHVQCTSFKQMKHCATVMQSAARGWAVCKMVAGQHNAAEAVQAVFRGHIAKQHYEHTQRCIVTVQAFARKASEQSSYCQFKSAAVVVQSVCRMLVGMVHAQKILSGVFLSNSLSALYYHRQYIRARCSFVALQAIVRCTVQRQAFVAQCNASNLIATTVRRFQARKQFLCCQFSATLIQSLARGGSMRTRFDRQRAQLVAEKRILKQKLDAVRALQRIMRQWLSHRHELAAANQIQRWAAPLVFKRRWRRAMRSLTSVQARVRSMYIRKRSTKKVREARRKIAAVAAAATEEMKLGNRTASALEALLGSTKLAVVMRACQTLEVATRLSSVCCENFARGGAAPVLYSMIRSCNRSEPHLMLLKHALSTLRHVSREPRLVAYVSEPAEAVEVLVDLLQMFRDKEQTFLLAVSVLGLVCKYKAKTIAKREEWMCADVEKRLQSIAQLLTRKHEIEQKRKHGLAKQKSRPIALLQKLLAGIPPRK